jgi:hypothetical protein
MEVISGRTEFDSDYRARCALRNTDEIRVLLIISDSNIACQEGVIIKQELPREQASSSRAEGQEPYLELLNTTIAEELMRPHLVILTGNRENLNYVRIY